MQEDLQRDKLGSMSEAARMGDQAHAPEDAHHCSECPHSVSGPAAMGSPDVLINDRPAVRVGDSGTHDLCCDSNSWVAVAGAATLLINDRPAVRAGDATQHCGGSGKLIEGSADVDVGDEGSELAAPFAITLPESTPLG